MRRYGIFISVLLCAISLQAAKVENLRCEYMIDPIGVDVDTPRLSWIIQSSQRGDLQRAYQIIVSSSPENIRKNRGDVWDSGRLESEQSNFIVFHGKQLQSSAKYYWKVRVWNKDGQPSQWSKVASWTMGLLSQSAWASAKWIAFKDEDQWKREWKEHKDAELNTPHNAEWPSNSWPWLTGKDSTIFTLYNMAVPHYDSSPLFRKEFFVNKKVKSATLYICGLGYYEAFLNGRKIGNHVLDPGWTNFDQRSLYVTYDVTKQLKPDKNALGVMLGRGQYNPVCNDIWGLSKSAWIDQPKLIALLKIAYSDGSKDMVATDQTWKTAGGPIIYDDTRQGELYDARLEQQGWSSPDFNDNTWKNVSVVMWNARLESQMMPPIRCFTPLTPVKIYPKEDGTTVYNIGRNITGWARVKVKGFAGAKVLVEYCETPSDSLLVKNLPPSRFKYQIKDKHYATFYDKGVNVRQQNGYILRGGGVETFECHFSYKGFQFIRITADKGVSVEKVEGVPVHTDVEVAGSFKCSNPLLNRIQQNAVNSLLNNYHSIATDCPHREKQGWTADNYMSSQAAMYNFNMAAFYSKWLTDLAGTQSPSGGLSTVAPSTNYDGNQSTAWPAAIVLVPWDLYQFYGDTQPMARNFDVMNRFALSSLLRQAKDKPEIIHDVLGDWVAPLMELNDTIRNNTMSPPEGTTLYGTASHFLVVKRLSEIGKILGKEADSKKLDEWSKRISTAFNQEFFDKDRAVYHGDIPTSYRQSANVIPLEYGLVPEKNKTAVLSHLVNDIQAKGNRLGTGFLGTMALMKYLPEVNPELAYTLATQEKYPSWGHMIRQGANSMWESWDGYDSHNHTPFCLISAYFYKYLAGIQSDPVHPGFKHIVIHPSVVGDLKSVSAYHDCMYGRIESNWQLANGMLAMNISIPANTTATVYVPARSLSEVTESGKPVTKTDGVEFLRMENGEAVFRVKSGKYQFQSDVKGSHIH